MIMQKLKINEKYIINKNIMSQAGMLYKGAKVRLLSLHEEGKEKIMIEDMMGRIFYVKEGDITQ